MSWASEMTLAELAEGGLFSDGDWVESKDQDPDGSVRLTQLADVGVGSFRDRSNRRLREDQATSLRCTFLEPDDVMIARMPDPIGRACLAPSAIGRAVTAVDVAVLRIRRPDADPRYIMWAINSPAFHSRVVALQSGTTRKRISRKNLATLSVPVPPLEEQHRIVSLLEDHLSRLDAAEVDLEGGIRKAGVLWLSTLMSIRHTFVGDHTATIGEVAETALGKMLDAKKQSGLPTPYLRNTNVRWGSFDLSDVQTTPLTPAEAERLMVRAGDIMVCEGGEPGRCAVWTDGGREIAFQKALHRVRVRDPGEVLPEFLALMLTEAIRSGRSDRLFTGTTIKHLPQEKLRTITLPVPPIAAQRRALERARSADEGLTRLRVEAAEVKARSAALRRSLLSAAFSGRLTGVKVVQPPEMVSP